MQRHYDKNVILALDQRDPGINLKNYLEQKKQVVEIIQIKFGSNGHVLPLSDSDETKLSSLTSKSRLYIDGHGGENNILTIYGSRKGGNPIAMDTLVSLIVKHVNFVETKGLRVSLHVCQAAKIYEFSKMKACFSGLLFDALTKQGMLDIEVVANVDNMQVVRINGNKRYYKLSSGKIEEWYNQAKNAFWKKYQRTQAQLNMSDFYNELESTTIITKKLNHILPHRKIIYFTDNDQCVRIDYYALKNWDKKCNKLFLHANVSDIFAQYKLKQTYSEKLNFLREMRSTYSANMIFPMMLNSYERILESSKRNTEFVSTYIEPPLAPLPKLSAREFNAQVNDLFPRLNDSDSNSNKSKVEQKLTSICGVACNVVDLYDGINECVVNFKPEQSYEQLLEYAKALSDVGLVVKVAKSWSVSQGMKVPAKLHICNSLDVILEKIKPIQVRLQNDYDDDQDLYLGY